MCVHNIATSQMAEAFLNAHYGDRFEAHSAGLEPGTLNPLVVRAMKERGIDISRKKTQSVFDLFKSGQMFGIVITVCDEAVAERCPTLAGVTKRIHWSFLDPSSLEGVSRRKA